jgi:NAD-dependent SIR2 family protein deacetylase
MRPLIAVVCRQCATNGAPQIGCAPQRVLESHARVRAWQATWAGDIYVWSPAKKVPPRCEQCGKLMRRENDEN